MKFQTVGNKIMLDPTPDESKNLKRKTLRNSNNARKRLFF